MKLATWSFATGAVTMVGLTVERFYAMWGLRSALWLVAFALALIGVVRAWYLTEFSATAEEGKAERDDAI